MRSEKTDDAQVGIDGGYIRGRLKQGKFGVIVGKSILALSGTKKETRAAGKVLCPASDL
jgi:hypothetical protein